MESESGTNDRGGSCQPAALAQVANLLVTKATYETRSRASEDAPWDIVETGTHYITADGRYRVDKLRDGASTFEITDNSGAKFTGDNTTREVRPAPTMSAQQRTEADSRINDADLQSTNGPLVIGDNMEYLGTKQVGGLTPGRCQSDSAQLSVQRRSPVDGDVAVLSADPVYGTQPISPSCWRRTVGGFGPDVRREVTEVTTEFVSPSIFTVPEGYTLRTDR